MTEQTNPDAGVSLDEAVDRLASQEQPEGQADETQEVQQADSSQQEAQGQAQEGELTPDDIPDEQPPEQPAVDAFEIVHDGQQHKLTREETIRYAQQGFDYTQKTQALAAQNRQMNEQLQRLAQIDQVAPQLQGQLAQVKALEAQLAQFHGVNWVQEAANDPGRYAQLRAQYDVLRDAHAQAVGQYQQMDGAVKGQLREIVQQRLQAEAQRLPEFVPEWKDQAKFEAGKQALSKHFAETYQIDPRELNAEANTAFKVAVLWKAMKYDQLLRSKADKSKTLRQRPPVTVPGSANPQTAQADKGKQAQQRLKKSGSMEDAVAVLLNR